MNILDIARELALIFGTIGGIELIKWVFNRKTEKQLNALEVKQKDFELDEKRIAELHASIDKANDLNDKLLERISAANAAVDKYVDRNRELSDRLYAAEQEVNRVNNVLTEEQRRNANLERKLGQALRLADHYKEWRCEWPDCQDPRGRRPPNPTLKQKTYTPPVIQLYNHTSTPTPDNENKPQSQGTDSAI